MNEIKRVLQCDIKTLNQSIVDIQLTIDKAFNTMLEATPGSYEYRNAKVIHDSKSQDKWFYFGMLRMIERITKLISDKEEAEKLEMDLIAYDYFKSVGAEELPF